MLHRSGALFSPNSQFKMQTKKIFWKSLVPAQPVAVLAMWILRYERQRTLCLGSKFLKCNSIYKSSRSITGWPACWISENLLNDWGRHQISNSELHTYVHTNAHTETHIHTSDTRRHTYTKKGLARRTQYEELEMTCSKLALWHSYKVKH